MQLLIMRAQVSPGPMLKHNVKILASEIDGKNSLLDISDKWEISMEKLNEASKKLLDVGLIS